MRQVDAMLRRMDSRKHNDYAIHASFHGIKLKLKGNKEPQQTPSLHEEETKAIDSALQIAKLRKQEAFAKRHGK